MGRLDDSHPLFGGELVPCKLLPHFSVENFRRRAGNRPQAVILQFEKEILHAQVAAFGAVFNFKR